MTDPVITGKMTAGRFVTNTACWLLAAVQIRWIREELVKYSNKYNYYEYCSFQFHVSIYYVFIYYLFMTNGVKFVSTTEGIIVVILLFS